MSTLSLRESDPASAYYGALTSRAAEIAANYRKKRPQSEALFARANAVLPGGYSRDAVMRAPFPPFFTMGEGARLIDEDGLETTDFWFNATSLAVGHAHPAVVAAATAQVSRGSAFFGMTVSELALAEELVGRIASAEEIRFTNSGSEAVMMALRFARAFTGRDLVIKFEGSYHGSYDDVQWSVAPAIAEAGAAHAPTPVADTSGLPTGAGRVLVLPYNDVGALEAAVAAYGAGVAAVLVEPMANRIGLVMPDAAFVDAAQKAARAASAVLIFDEVIAFRLAHGGAQAALGIRPDLTTLGKLIGGGFPVGAVTGRADILAVSAPQAKRRATHAGTFNANPVTAAAGLATLELLTPSEFERINALGEQLRARLRTMIEGLPLQVSGAGSLFKLSATADPIRDYRTAARADKEWERVASLLLLDQGFMLTPQMQGCVSTVTRQGDVDALLGAIEQFVLDV